MMVNKETYADKPWLKSYKFGPYPLEKTINIPRIPLYKLLDDAAVSWPDRVAIQFQGRGTTFQELKLYADKLATALADLGVKKGDRVAVMVPNCPQIIISEFGILKMGGVYMAISPLAKALELEYQLTESGAEVIITTDKNLELINSIKHKTRLRKIIITSLKDFTPEEEAEIIKVPGTHNLRELLEQYEAKPPEVEIDPMEDLSTLFFTGGATGVPKGVMRTHYSDVAFAFSGFPWLMKPLERGAKGKASLLVPLPLYHGAGNHMVLQSVCWGLRLILLSDPRDTDALIRGIHEFRPLMVVSAPTQLMRAVQKKVGRTPSLVSAGTAPLPEEISVLWKKETGMPVTQSYALTEVGALYNLTAFSKLTGFILQEKHAIGVPCPNLEAKVVSDTGEEVPFGGVGEIWLRGPTCMKGYWPTPGSGLKDGWVATGDVGRMDDDGYFYLVDRVKDMVNVSGLKVYTVNIDEVLFKHPAVAMAVAIGIPDPERPGSDRVKAFIKLKDDYEGKVTAEDIIDYCRAHLPPYAAPKFVEFRKELPLTTSSEKLFKRVLREEEITKMKARGEIK